VPEGPPARHTDAGAAALRVVLLAAVTLVSLVAAGCGDEAGEDGARQTATVAETVSETATETAPEENTNTGASAPTEPTEPTGSVVRFRGNGDRILPPVRVGRGGATLVWRNDDAVFTIFADFGIAVDSVDPGGEAFLPAGRRLLEVVASGGWRIQIQNARRER
jgi:hypothetical protein